MHQMGVPKLRGPSRIGSYPRGLALGHITLFGLLCRAAVVARCGSFLLPLQFLVLFGLLLPIALRALEAVIRSERHDYPLPSALRYGSNQ